MYLCMFGWYHIKWASQFARSIWDSKISLSHTNIYPNILCTSLSIHAMHLMICSSIAAFYLKTYLYLLRVCDPCIYPIRVPPLQKPLLCPEPMLMAIKNRTQKLEQIAFYLLEQMQYYSGSFKCFIGNYTIVQMLHTVYAAYFDRFSESILTFNTFFAFKYFPFFAISFLNFFLLFLLPRQSALCLN